MQRRSHALRAAGSVGLTLLLAVTAISCGIRPACPSGDQDVGLGCLSQVLQKLESSVGVRFTARSPLGFDTFWDWSWQSGTRESGYVDIYVYSCCDGAGVDDIEVIFGPVTGRHVPDQVSAAMKVMDELAPGSGSWAREQIETGAVDPFQSFPLGEGPYAAAQFGSAYAELYPTGWYIEGPDGSFCYSDACLRHQFHVILDRNPPR